MLSNTVSKHGVLMLNVDSTGPTHHHGVDGSETIVVATLFSV